MYCVGLTGTIASGKTTVSHFFKSKGITIISADQSARELTAAGKPALEAIINHFGPSLLLTTGELNRAGLREIIFNDPTQRLWLEQLLHPLIRQDIYHKIQQVTSSYCIIEIPLLTRPTDYPYLDRILLIMTDREQQLNRIMQRDKNTRSQAEAILAIQIPNSIRQKYAHDIVYNENSTGELEKKIENLHYRYLHFAQQKP